MADYIASYAFELKEPVEDQHGGYAELRITTDKPIETAEDWQEVARQCFKQGKGNYKRVSVARIGEILEPSDTSAEIISGEIIE